MSKVNSGTILLAFVAVLFGLGGTYMLRKSMEKRPVVEEKPVAVKARPPQKLTVPMASRTMDAGHTVALDDIALVKLSREDIKKYGIKSAFMTNPDQIIGKTLKQDLKRGETFDTKYFFPSGVGMGIAQRIKPGQRAITISLTPTNALMGFAGAGQKVDVLFHYGEESSIGMGSNAGQAPPEGRRFDPTMNSYRLNGRNGSGSRGGGMDRLSQAQQKYKSATVTLVQNAEILALGDKSIPTENLRGVPSDQRIAVTLLLSPNDAQKVKVADGHGELSLTLRAPLDKEHVQVADTSKLENILKFEDKIRLMQVFRGQDFSELQFDEGGSISPRIVDSPEAYDPSKSETYDPTNNSPWLKDKIPSQPASTRKAQPLFDESYKSNPLESSFIEHGSSVMEPSSNAFGDQLPQTNGPLSREDEINETLQLFGNVLGDIE